MHDFQPKPRHNSDQWKQFGARYEGNNVNSASDAFEGFTSHTFMAFGNFDSERDAPPYGYLFPFNTASDCLLWIRWASLPMAQNPERPHGSDENAAEIIRDAIIRIDSAPAQTEVRMLLEELQPLWDVNLGGFILYRYSPVTDYLDEHGTEEGWREYLEDGAVRRESDRWVMSEAGWKTLEEKFSNSPGDIIEPAESWEEDDNDA